MHNNINGSPITNNEILNNSKKTLGKTNQNFTDSKNQIVDMESTSSVVDLLNRKN
jgi:hypothetical protein